MLQMRFVQTKKRTRNKKEEMLSKNDPSNKEIEFFRTMLF